LGRIKATVGFRRWVRSKDGAHDEEEHAHEEASNNEECLAAEVVNRSCNEEESGSEFEAGEDTASKKTSVLSSLGNLVEDNWCVCFGQ
jgi:hypothetical protein